MQNPNTDVVQRFRVDESGERVSYWVLRDRVSGCPFGRRYETREEAQAVRGEEVV